MGLSRKSTLMYKDLKFVVRVRGEAPPPSRVTARVRRASQCK